MIERRLLLLEDVGHHAFLATQQNIVDVLLLLHDGAQLSVKFGCNVENLLELIQHNNHAVLLTVGFLNQRQHILKQYASVYSRLE